ncbi:MAG: hypothetical protein KDA42_06925 [Planctomycetales bacterium]|nr:hypothetical protein [Planctomycetales bacterium]
MSAEPELHWRETYFIFFDAANRPSLAAIETALKKLNPAYEVRNPIANDAGLLESISLNSPRDNAALEITYEEGEAVVEQTTELAKQLKLEAEAEDVAKLLRASARLDVMHFEMVNDDPYADFDDEDSMEMLDPSCLLLVVESLVELTEGLPIDPASGAILP